MTGITNFTKNAAFWLISPVILIVVVVGVIIIETFFPDDNQL